MENNLSKLVYDSLNKIKNCKNCNGTGFEKVRMGYMYKTVNCKVCNKENNFIFHEK